MGAKKLLRFFSGFAGFAAAACLGVTGAQGLDIGDEAPGFNLFGVDHRYHSPAMYRSRPALVVVFLSNECPVSQDAEPVLAALAREYGGLGVAFLAINPVPADKDPAEGFPEMSARAAEKGFPFPYLCDETQRTAGAYGVETTPEVFLFDAGRRLAYKGAVGHRPGEPPFLGEALGALLAGRPVERPEAHAIGCLVDYRCPDEARERFNR